jgi:small GTP-binding protein
MLDITDTAGQEEYSQIRDELLEDGHGFIIVYSITDPASFDEVSSLYESILKTKNKDEGIPCILAGNKVDLEEERAVPREQAEELVERMGGLCKFYETSAKAEPSINVKEIFEELVRLINQKEMSTEPQINEPTAPEKNGKNVTKQNSNPNEKKVEKRKKACNIL